MSRRSERINQAVAARLVSVEQKLDSAVDMMRCIAAMGKKAGSESAKNWLLSHGYPLEPGGYVPGKGFTEL